MPRHLNVVAQTLRGADGNVRFFRTGGGPPPCALINFEIRGAGGDATHVFSASVRFFRTGRIPTWVTLGE